ncbi:metal ABC transporter substrate-binding protein [Velocimicrobium porci]|uniref:Zinc ABC transporter substrate-binding protein n=1 Tax=Velocimicrobium porci TaxID=2606634 RepID=A0A6L5XUX8_9FIRM|nr:metal ABC transporter substrate-binding protein [Velocimicrobium porci]MSS62625.1 zinc ABC transporter substrate-binding protein [Velocimicrobium porci]
MIQKNKILVLIVALILCMGLVSGCGKIDSSADKMKEKNKISIVCTNFPQYDWVREIIGKNTEQFDLTLLMDDGVDLHNYQPTAGDIAKVGACDIFIYVGGESDEWVEDALEKTTNKDMQVINLLEVLGANVKAEEVVEGMQSGEEEDEKQEESLEYDEHVWLSLKNTKILVDKITESIVKINTSHEKEFEQNRNRYITKIDELDKNYENTVKASTNRTILFGDRFPFRYLADDYNIKYYAAFAGCSTETEASFETITFLAKKVDELELSSVLVIENSNQKIADTICKNTKEKNQKILVMNSLQSVTKAELEGDFTYLNAMEDNLEILKQALN